MAYAPYQWQDGNAGGTPLTADRLNALEGGVKTAHDIGEAAAAAAATKAPLARGLPAGGSAGQLLVKNSSADYAVGWQTPSTTVPSHTHPQSQIDNLSSDLNAIRLNAFGATTRTRAPSACAYMVADSNQSAGTNVVFSTNMAVDNDTDNMITLGSDQANPTMITIPVAGIYLLEFHAVSTATSGILYTRFLLNAPNSQTVTNRVTGYSLASQAAGATEAIHSHFAITRPLAAGDVLQFALYHTVASTLKNAFFTGTRQTRVGARFLSAA